jgi:hypothetical protein
VAPAARTITGACAQARDPTTSRAYDDVGAFISGECFGGFYTQL